MPKLPVVIMFSFKSTNVFCLCLISLSFLGMNSDALNVAHVLQQKFPHAFQYITNFIKVSKENLLKLAKSFIFSTVKLEDVNILYYRENGQYVRFDPEDNIIDIDFSQRIVIIIHGYKSTATEAWVKKMAIAYHNQGFQNTLAVNWSRIAQKDYLTASTSTRHVGQIIASWLYIKVLKKNKSLMKKVHLIGYSLGAHVSGFVGNSVYNMTGCLLGRISGLDVAAPIFEYPFTLSLFRRLDKSDAAYIDSYHTSPGILGFSIPTGHQDFYINPSSSIQPGCIKKRIGESYTCSHRRVVDIFIKTISSKRYVSRKCDDVFRSSTCDDVWVIMSDHNNGTHINGVFFLETDQNGNPL